MALSLSLSPWVSLFPSTHMQIYLKNHLYIFFLPFIISYLQNFIINTVCCSKIRYPDCTRQLQESNLNISNTENQRAALAIKYINKQTLQLVDWFYNTVQNLTQHSPNSVSPFFYQMAPHCSTKRKVVEQLSETIKVFSRSPLARALRNKLNDFIISVEYKRTLLPWGY